MDNVWFTSDTHFNHAKLIEPDYCSRPFSCVEEMNEALIVRWNERVRPDDTVYHLGDFAMHPRDEIPNILSRLNGRVVLIRGNHDHKKTLGHFQHQHARLDLPHEGAVGPYRKGVWLHLVHSPGDARPEPTTPTDRDVGLIVLCGHVHNNWVMRRVRDLVPGDDRRDHGYRYGAFRTPHDIVNVGVDVWNYRPVSLDEIAARLFKEAP